MIYARTHLRSYHVGVNFSIVPISSVAFYRANYTCRWIRLDAVERIWHARCEVVIVSSTLIVLLLTTTFTFLSYVLIHRAVAKTLRASGSEVFSRLPNLSSHENVLTRCHRYRVLCLFFHRLESFTHCAPLSNACDITRLERGNSYFSLGHNYQPQLRFSATIF